MLAAIAAPLIKLVNTKVVNSDLSSVPFQYYLHFTVNEPKT